MQVRHLVIAAMLVSAGAAQASVHQGQLTGWAVTTKVVGSTNTGSAVVPVPAPLELTPAPVVAPVVTPPATTPVTVTPPVAATPVVTAPGAAEVPEPSSIALMLAGVMGVGALRRRRAK